MGQKVSNFFKEVAKTASKAATSFVLGKVPVVGDALANKINSMYKHGGKVKPFADGGAVDKFAKPTQAVNTPAQLIAAIKKLPDEAAKAGLSIEDVKEAVADAKKGEVKVAEPAVAAVAEAAKKRGGPVVDGHIVVDSHHRNVKGRKVAIAEHKRKVGKATKGKKSKKSHEEKEVELMEDMVALHPAEHEAYHAKARGGMVNLTPTIF